MKPIRLTEKEEIIEVLQEIELWGYGFTTKNLWNDIKEEISHPTLLIAKSVDGYAHYKEKDNVWGNYLIKGFDSKNNVKIIVILGSEEYFLKEIFHL